MFPQRQKYVRICMGFYHEFDKIVNMRMIFSVSDTGILGKRNSEFSQQESNLRPSDY